MMFRLDDYLSPDDNVFSEAEPSGSSEISLPSLYDEFISLVFRIDGCHPGGELYFSLTPDYIKATYLSSDKATLVALDWFYNGSRSFNEIEFYIDPSKLPSFINMTHLERRFTIEGDRIKVGKLYF